jgi:hypothetical protein
VKRLLIIIALTVILANTASASDEIQTLRSAISAYRDHHVCPPSGVYDILRFEGYCKSYCDRGWTCHGNKDTDPCQIDSASDACRQFSEGSRQCLSDMNEKNQVILDYDQIVRRCGEPERASSTPSATPSRPTGSALLGASQQAQQKADEARAKARDALNKTAEERAKRESEKRELKAAANALPPWCQGMIDACEHRAASLANATQGTQSQCRAYCQILKIENCNGGSSTVREAAQTCTAGAERDQKTEAERERATKERAAQREAEERRKWHCFGEAGNVSQGFQQCKSECSAYFSSSHCTSACYASGDGSISNGRSCFREP